MTTDALDPGPDGDYPFIERNPDGTVNRGKQPMGVRGRSTPSGRPILDAAGHPSLIDPELTLPDGRRVSDLDADAP